MIGGEREREREVVSQRSEVWVAHTSDVADDLFTTGMLSHEGTDIVHLAADGEPDVPRLGVLGYLLWGVGRHGVAVVWGWW